MSPLETSSTSRSKCLSFRSDKYGVIKVPRSDHVLLQGSQNNVHAPRHSAWQRTVAMAGSKMDASTIPNS
eukprot:496781-Amphidinium_carterae.2